MAQETVFEDRVISEDTSTSIWWEMIHYSIHAEPEDARRFTIAVLHIHFDYHLYDYPTFTESDEDLPF